MLFVLCPNSDNSLYVLMVGFFDLGLVIFSVGTHAKSKCPC